MKTFKFTKFWLIPFLFLCSLSVQAVDIDGINNTLVPIAERSDAALKKALPEALGRVLIKISGNPSIMTVPAIQTATKKVDQYVQSYSYITQNDIEGDSQLYLNVTFDTKSLADLLEQANQPVWSSDRPLVLAWMQLGQGDQAQVLPSSSNDLLITTLRAIASQRGVPVLLPVMDLQDQTLVEQTDQPLSINHLQMAAKRYGVNTVFAGEIQQADTVWRGDWLLWVKDQPFRWQTEAPNQEQLMDQAVQQVANLLANQLAVVDDKSVSDVQLEIFDVDDLDAYADVVKVLNQLDPVTNVGTNDMSDTHVLFQVTVNGGVHALAQALQASRHFAAMPMGLQTSDGQASLYYKWVPNTNKKTAQPTKAAEPTQAPSPTDAHERSADTIVPITKIDPFNPQRSEMGVLTPHGVNQ